MPSKKVKKTTRKVAKTAPRARTSQKALPQRQNRFSQFRWGESYTSFLLGVVVIVVAVLFGVSLFKEHTHYKDISAIQTVATPTVAVTPTPQVNGTTKTENGQKIYSVKEGDSLWSIAEKFYNSGYNWTDIARANNLADPSTINVGNQLVIPSVTAKTATIQQTTVQADQQITGKTYTVVKGDDLWDIAVKAYGDGYRWPDIAKANNLAQPGMIFSGNVLTIPR